MMLLRQTETEPADTHPTAKRSATPKQ
jgi:hypothetical protein